MPTYEYRCRNCGRESSFFYKTYADYDAASAAAPGSPSSRACPYCGHHELTRLITRVTVQTPDARNFANLSSGEMLSVLEGGDRGEVEALMRQTGQTEALENPTTRRLLDNATGANPAGSSDE